jgi:hypothetical protein
VYGTAQPPKGVSGLVRAAAYKYPDHFTRHWMMLLLADRIDAMEHRIRSVGGVATMAAVLLLGGVGVGLARRSARADRPRHRRVMVRRNVPVPPSMAGV